MSGSIRRTSSDERPSALRQIEPGLLAAHLRLSMRSTPKAGRAAMVALVERFFDCTHGRASAIVDALMEGGWLGNHRPTNTAVQVAPVIIRRRAA